MNDLAEAWTSFGGFSLGGLRLALPMSAIREVVDGKLLAELPCRARCVVGGIDVRGTLIPVVDLDIALERAARSEPSRCVVIIAHDGKLLGLLADAMSGIFEPTPGSIARANIADGTVSLFLASVKRSDNDETVSVLSPEALSRLRDVPMVDDREPRVEFGGIVDAQAAPDASIPLLLFRCNEVPLAVETAVVQATLFNPKTELLALASDRSLSVVDYDGAKVAALDLLDVCGLGQRDCTPEGAALVVTLPVGAVALLISDVIDVLRIRPDDVKPILPFASPRADLFSGSLPCSLLRSDLVAPAGTTTNQYLVIDAAKLVACDELTEFAKLSGATRNGTSTARASATLAPAALRRSMITYMLDSERASPLEQITEIIPYQDGGEVFSRGGALLGLMVSRGRSIPVMCLSQLLGEARCVPKPGSTMVLVVESGAGLVGFAVRTLRSLEEAQWESAMPNRNVAGPNVPPIGTGHSLQVALFGSRSSDRVIPIVDLVTIAAALLAQHAATPATQTAPIFQSAH